MHDTADGLAELLHAAGYGDDAAATAFVRHTMPTVQRLCRSLGDASDVDDLVSETYLRALRAARTYRNESPAITWLATIARRVCADHVRGEVRRRRLLSRAAASRPATSHSGYLEGTELEALIRTLDTDRRDALLLTAVAGFSYHEAAELLGCPIGTVRSRVARARADLVRLNALDHDAPSEHLVEVG